MISVDTNILVYAHRQNSSFHEQAKEVLSQLAEGSSPWAISWPCIHEFIAVVSNPRVFEIPSTNQEIVRQLEYWFESPTVEIISETKRHWEVLKKSFLGTNIKGSVIHDLRIYAICKQNGVTKLYSADRDFSRFKGIKVENPLV